MEFRTDNVGNSLNLMWKGMLAIFIAITLIWAAVFIMAKIGARLKKRKQLKEQSQTAETQKIE